MNKRSLFRATSLVLLVALAGCTELVGLAGKPGSTGLKGFSAGGTTSAQGRVFGSRPGALIDIRPVGGYPEFLTPEKVFDGDASSQWSSGYAGWHTFQWVGVDLGAPTAIDRARITWGEDYGTAFRIQVSDDQINWRDAATKTDGRGGTDELTFESVTGRYMRLWGDKAPNGRYLVNEVELYSAAKPGVNLAKGKPADASTIVWSYYAKDQEADFKRRLTAADDAFLAKRYAEAVAGYKEILALYGARLRGAAGDGVYDSVVYRLDGAEFRLKNPDAVGTPRRMTMLVVPEVDAAFTDPKGRQRTATRQVDPATVEGVKREFYFFSQSIMAITGGKVEWQLETVPLEGYKITHLNTYAASLTSSGALIVPGPADIEPALQPTLDAHAGTDAFFMLWPGTGHDANEDGTNGCMGSATVTVGGKPQRRPMVVDNDLLDGMSCNVSFFHHELFHEIEAQYPDLTGFPRAHGSGRRNEWPKEFVGISEGEFMKQVYKAYVLPVDGLARFEWASGQNGESGYDIAKKGGATPTPTPEPTATPEALPTSEPEPEVVTPDRAVDGDTSTRWESADGGVQWIFVDLGATKTINRAELVWGDDAATAYGIHVYQNGAWRRALEVKDGHSGANSHTFRATKARYVRIYCRAGSDPNGYSLYDFKLFGSASPDVNLSQGRPAWASSVAGD
jgi:hypothetical protein